MSFTTDESRRDEPITIHSHDVEEEFLRELTREPALRLRARPVVLVRRPRSGRRASQPAFGAQG
jgi:hypothetical protein